MMAFRAIGRVLTPFATVADCPRNGRQITPAPVCRVELFSEYAEGIASLDGFSHLILLYWLDRAEMSLTIAPPFDGEARGVFATRAPCRPNPVGLSVVSLETIEPPATLLVKNLDCVDGTALLDVKPYLPTTDCEPDATMGWLARHATRR